MTARGSGGRCIESTEFHFLDGDIAATRVYGLSGGVGASARVLLHASVSDVSTRAKRQPIGRTWCTLVYTITTSSPGAMSARGYLQASVCAARWLCALCGETHNEQPRRPRHPYFHAALTSLTRRNYSVNCREIGGHVATGRVNKVNRQR